MDTLTILGGTMLLMILIGVPIYMVLIGSTILALVTPPIFRLPCCMNRFRRVEFLCAAGHPRLCRRRFAHERGGITTQIVDVVKQITGAIHGGLGITTIMAAPFLPPFPLRAGDGGRCGAVLPP